MSRATKTVKKGTAKASKQTAGKAPKGRNGKGTSKRAFNIPPHIREALQAARGPKEALAKFQDNSPGLIIFTLLTTLAGLVNAQIPGVFTTQNVNLFGDPNNHLDPLNFNGTVSAQTSGSFCLPQYCHKVVWIEICIPPWVPCASGQASASLDNLTGLSGLQITNINIPNVTVNGNTASATGTLQVSLKVSAPQITANGEAEASGGPDGFSIPVSASASASFSGFVVTAAITVSCDLNQPKLTAITIDTLTLEAALSGINIGDLGPFDSLLNGLGWQGLFTPLITALDLTAGSDQEFTNALLGVLQGVINASLS